MSLKTLQMIIRKAANKKENIMPRWRHHIIALTDTLNPRVFGLGICVSLWVLFGFSLAHSWMEEHLSFDVMSYKLFPVYLHLGCLCLVCITIAALTYFIFYRNNFGSWFSTLAFLFYTLAELILIVNALTMTIESRYKFYLESVIAFVLLICYTQVVSWQYRNYRDIQRRLHEEYIDRQISASRRARGDCVRIPLYGPIGSSTSSKMPNQPIHPTPGPSTRR